MTLGLVCEPCEPEWTEILTKELLFNSGLEKRVYAVLPLLLDSNQPGPPQSWDGRDLKDIDGHDFYTMLLEHILETPELVEEFSMPDAPGKFSIEPVWRWICSLREFNRLALTYAHLSTGLPVRAMVYTSLFYRDSSASPRNVFFSGDRLAFVARRSKTTWISNRESHAAHYMDKRASAVMMAYLLLCKPLEELFADDLQDRDELITSSAIDPNSLTEEEQDELEADAMEVEDSIEPDTVGSVDDQHDDLRAAKRVAQEGTYELLFNIAPMQLEKQLRPGQVYRTIQAVTKRFLGTSITVSAWRHMSVAWLRTLVLHHTPEPSLGALNVAHSQSQHAGRTARNVYGRTQLDHKFVSSEAQYGHQFVSEEWHKLMKLVDVEDQIQAEAVDGQTCVQQVVHKQVVVQSSRVRNASTQVQATVGTQTDPEVEACLDAEDDIDDITAGLDLDEAEAAGSSMPVAVPRAVEEAASTALQQEPSQHNDQTQQQEYEDQLWLAQCVRQAWKTTFRDWDQYRLAQAVTRHEAQDGWLLAVAPTGMGKTLCTLAHLQPRRVVVWVVPLRELARDLCRRFEQADIVSQWAKNDGRDMQVNVQVIVMTVDFLVGHGMRWVQTLVQQKRLAMLVMDEVHTMLVDTSYRDSLVRCPGRLDHLCQDPSVKCVGLTGTLCPKDERALLQQLDCTEDASYQTFRMPTMRTDLRLAVQQGTTKAFEMFVERHYDLLEQEGRVDRMLIFCDTKKQVEALSTQLARTLGHEQSLAVDADMSAEDTRAALEQWRSGTQSLVLVATSCLGAGLDMPNVRKVIWFGSGYNGYTLSQAFGRAGRDRRGGEATLWIPRGTAVLEDLQPFASMKRCLTFELGWLLDGKGHICAAAGAPACTVCSMMQPTFTARHPSREAHGAPVSHEGQTRAKRAQLMVPSAPIQSDDFNTALLWMSTYCWACSCSRDRLVAHHQPSSCPAMKGRCFRCHCRGHGSSNCQVTLGAGVCYRCWRPQKIGGERVVECTGRACAQRNREAIRALVASVSRSQTLRGIMQRMECPAELLAVGGRHFDPSEMQALVGWLYGAEGRVGHPRVLKFVIEAKRQFAMLK
ncbi:RecQ helicase family member [Monosiga brevicollis MX1]|uniref:DNA 3'-5' helicase n=1 Tax=Monosiga brevicollis TaxID=81824 RepID=A9UUP4_MONBE|nr:RecQ helicase family member [Monosiga brevicollis MX1]EDQ90938.1 RecQ helicase family member [Monosiga brevicollis MX1]|eukprot:XP_001744235.1 RecQ helicase family member [Monosiga brevicollis MX1]